MDIHEVFFATLYDRLVSELDLINEGTKEILILTDLCIEAVRNTISLVKQYILEHGFSTMDEEINFFKFVKPRFYSLLVFYRKVYELELNRPAGSREIELEYLKKCEARLFYFYEKHRDFYQYYRVGATYLDNRFFVRNSKESVGLQLEYGLDADPNFTTGRDFIVAKIEANERFRLYIEAAMLKLHPSNNVSAPYFSKDLTWTASKASLLELLYGLHSIGAFNNGKAELQQIAAFVEKNFDIKLGNYHRAFQEIRSRKKARTPFLDDMKKYLIERMDSMDDNLK